MRDDGMLEDITRRLYSKNIQDLRQIARQVGVKRPADGKKDAVIEAVMAIANGSEDPAARSTRGAPPKSREYDKQLVADIQQCREFYLTMRRGKGLIKDEEVLSVSDKIKSGGICSGILERGDKCWYLRVNGCKLSAGSDVTVQESFITRFKLREGDYIEGNAEKIKIEQGYGLTRVISVNGHSPESEIIADRADFFNFTSVYPDKQLFVSRGSHDLTGRMVDFFTPVGAGQRAVAYGSSRSGKSQLLMSVGAGICHNYPQSAVIALLLGARPEEEAEYRRALTGGRVFSTGLEDGEFAHRHSAALALKYAKRRAELGFDVILLVDGANRLVREGKDCSDIVKILASAGNFAEGASLMVMTALEADSESEFDEVFAAANMVIALSREGALMRLYPAMDLKRCFSAKPELLIGGEQIAAATKLRVEYGGAEGLFAVREFFMNTPDNPALIQKIKD